MNASSSYLKLPPFEELVELAKQNPEAFAVFKRDICEEMILSASQKMQGRLWAQQSHIDRVVNSSKNPCHANVKLMQELSSQMRKFQNALNYTPEREPEYHADVIPLHKYRQ
ncbi:hypothetical protein VA7868_00053 [Vibrio aerogenes CECT 7868]|uniref:DUF3135 domain-containing protein n=1 Tax=Vibrio aerogenes CECT 7868 TaxID=1216006 RepID=A0A1M5UBA2_9VIBR|nr:DUF3135 domain-containing protein [Vibrio aerogenes]SHH60188.1 hypothetical protein VA7868_00053 [Vibrio aerogenes CECT 7868]